MEKKEYIKPAIKVANIDSADIICTSGEPSSLDYYGDDNGDGYAE